MRSHVFAPRARRDLQSQIDYLNDQGAFDAADRLLVRIEEFVAQFLCEHPKTGAFLSHRDLWETWVPQTRLVLWYRFTDSTLEIARVWHTSQNRQGA